MNVTCKIKIMIYLLECALYLRFTLIANNNNNKIQIICIIYEMIKTIFSVFTIRIIHYSR